MKKDSDNYRQSAILDIINILKDNNIDMIIYDETLKDNSFNGIKVVNDLELFKKESSIILANRIDNGLRNVDDKIYTRDILFRD
jgi:UDPglucose 6-dehydrogenase